MGSNSSLLHKAWTVLTGQPLVQKPTLAVVNNVQSTCSEKGVNLLGTNIVLQCFEDFEIRESQ